MTRVARHAGPAQVCAGQVWHYRAYGLHIRSDVALPELSGPELSVPELSLPELSPDAPAPADLLIRRAALGIDVTAGGGHDRVIETQSASMWWPQIGAFRILAGREILVDPLPEVSDDLLAFPLLGPVLAVALFQAGHLLLHASAVSLAGAGVIIMGDKGAGKSTTASSLLAAGHRLIADDIVAFDRTDGAQLLPAFGQVKLSSAALARLDPRRVTVRPQVHAAIDKHRVLIPADQVAPVTPVARIYAIERGSALAVTPLPTPAAIALLMRFAYVARFGGDGLAGDAAARHFRQVVALAQRGVLRRLVVPDGLDRLPAVIKAIEEDVAR